MAPNKKKKKNAGNPARGFATVSLPSKTKERNDDSDTAETETTTEPSHGKTSKGMVDQNATTSSATQDLKDMTPEQLEAHLEDAELQSLIETHVIRCRSDATRQTAKLENERRQLRSQSHRMFATTWLTDDCIDDILQRRSASQKRSRLDAPISVDDTDLLLKLWTLRTVLTGLRMPDVDNAIKELLVNSYPDSNNSADYIWGLQEVLEWYAINKWQDTPDYEHPSKSSLPDASLDQSISGSVVEDTSTQIIGNSSPPAVSIPPIDEPEGMDHESLPSLSPSDSEDDDPSLLTDKYLRLQELLFKTESRLNRTGCKSHLLQDRRRKLQGRIEHIRRDVLFQRAEAEAIWNANLQELKIDIARSTKHQKHVQRLNEKTKSTGSELGAEDDVLGDMFTEEGTSQDSTAAVEPATVRIVDFGKWTGVSPRKLMEDCCHDYDARCTIKFSTLSSTSYSIRQRIDVKWSTPTMIDSHALSALPNELSCLSTTKVLLIEMNTIATANLIQAESYLSTLLVFLLVHSSYCEQKQVQRLPTTWRELYTDVTRSRQSHVDRSDKDCLIMLRELIIEAESIRKSHTKTRAVVREDASVTQNTSKQMTRIPARLCPEAAREQWLSRSTSAAYQSILRTREQLPVHKYKDVLLQQIERNQILIICADTGAGKSTQVPSFVLEHELTRGHDCRLLVTQPRRISAISLARRVSLELGEHKTDIGTDRSLVGYAIRLESRTSNTTRLTYATTGVLLRMIEASSQLEGFDYLILDEVHERTMDIDLLFIALRRLLHRRADLKVILMSATIDAQKFSDYFDNAPVVEVPGRTFPVQIGYLEDAIEATLSIANGDISVLDDDDAEIDAAEASNEPDASSTVSQEYSNATRSRLAQTDQYRIDYGLIAALAEAIATKTEYLMFSSAILIFMPGIAEIRRMQNALLARDTFASEWVIHLLHSSFSTEDLEQAFSVPPRGWRKIVIATNIAETGITIPDVTAVIDTCKEKVMRFDERRQLSRLTEGFISRSSARQRRGRAARVQEGICFHLVTRYRFEQLMLEQHVPEMLRLSLQDPILRVKVWNLGSIEETLAAAIDPPNSKNVRRAIDKLKEAGALTSNEELTGLGRKIARLPLEVVLCKLAIFGIVFRCLDAVLVIVASLSSKSPFVSDRGGHQVDPRLAFARGDSDLISTLNAYQGWRKAKLAGQGVQFCRKHHLHDQTLSSIEDQKIQLLVYLVDAGLVHLDPNERSSLSRARTNTNHKTFFSSPDRYNTNEDDAVLSCIFAMAFYPRILVREGKGWRNVYSNQQVNLLPNSVIRAAVKPPKWLCFHEAMQARSGSLNVLETSRIPEMVIATVLGTAEIRFFSGVVILDSGKVRFSLRQWKEIAAIKILRESLLDGLRRCWQAHGLAVRPSDQLWIDLFTKLLTGKVTSSA